jgi:hypothetical protein
MNAVVLSLLLATSVAQDQSSSAAGLVSVTSRGLSGGRPQDLKVKPPRAEYRKAEDLTIWSTGETGFRPGSNFAWWGGFASRGRNVRAPLTVTVVFATRRAIDGRDTRSDADLAQWAQVSNVVMRWAGDGFDPVTSSLGITSKNDSPLGDPRYYRASYERIADNDAALRILVGRTFVEKLTITLPAQEFVEMAQAPEVFVRLGSHEDSIKGSALKPFVRLAEAMKALQ